MKEKNVSVINRCAENYEDVEYGDGVEKRCVGQIDAGRVSLWMRNRMKIEKNRYNDRPVHQTAVHLGSLCFRLRRKKCLGSGNEKISIGRVVPSRGSRDSVRDREVGGGGKGDC